MLTKFFFSFYVVRLNFGKKKLTPALFVKDFCSPKLLRPPKAANSERNEGRYYMILSAIDEKHLTAVILVKARPLTV